MVKKFDDTITKAWNAMNEAWQMGNYASARKISISLRPLTMPDWKEKWINFDTMIVESFGGSLADTSEIDEMKNLISRITFDKNKISRDNEELQEKNTDLKNEIEKLHEDIEKLNEEILNLRQQIEDMEDNSIAVLNKNKEKTSEAPDSQQLINIMENLTLARKLNGHLFYLTKQMQYKLEKLGESVVEFELENIEKYKLEIAEMKTAFSS